MTNEMIILHERVVLMEQGILEGTGQFVTVEDGDGNKKQLELPEEIHTYAAWKEMGYQVQKGQKAIASFTIWKHTSKENEETGERKENMFMKRASFFKRSQVETMA